MAAATLLFFLASGFCCLVYEIVWLRLAMAAFGVNAPLVSTFLSCFMAGLGLGSWGAGVFARRFKTRGPVFFLRCYAALEAAAALSSVLAPLALRFGQDALEGAARGSGSYYVLSGLALAGALLPWCALLGATLPVAMAALRPREGKSAFAGLYAANALGAALGAFAAVFFLIEWLGLSGTLRAAAGVNLMVALSALALSSGLPRRSGALKPRTAGTTGRSSALPLLFLTGFVSMGLEVVWTRAYLRFAGNTVYTFANILVFYLLATLAGSAAYRRAARAGRVPDDETLLALAGFCGLLTLVCADPRLVTRTQDLRWFLAQLGVGVVPFSAAVGFLTPALVDRASEGDPGATGLAYAVNVLGCIAGPLAAGFVLLPRAGAPAALVLLCAPLVALGARKRALLAASAALILFSATKRRADAVILRDYEAEVEAGGEGRDRYLLVNGVSMTFLDPITKIMAHLPMALSKTRPLRALDLCFGMGTTFRSLLSWNADVTAVELVPSVPRLFGFFHPDGPGRASETSGARIVVDDARRFLRRAGETFDVITIDAPPPANGAYTALLFSREFYALAKTRLAAGGILAQWIPGGVDPAVSGSMVDAVRAEFAHVRVFRSAAGWGFHVLASGAEIELPSDGELARRMPDAARRDLSEWGPMTLRRTLDGEVDLGPLHERLRSIPTLTDDRPFNEYFFVRYNLPKLARRLELGRAR